MWAGVLFGRMPQGQPLSLLPDWWTETKLEPEEKVRFYSENQSFQMRRFKDGIKIISEWIVTL